MKLTKQKLEKLIQEVYYDSRKQHDLYADSQDHVGERVWVHTERTQRNNGYNGMIGVYKAGGSDNKVGTPYFKTNAIALQDCVFKVSGGNAIEKIQTTGKRTLVAGCTGTVVQIEEESYNPAVGVGKQPYEKITFSPKVGYFYALGDPDQRPLIGCTLLYFTASEDGQWTMTGIGLTYETI